MHDRTLRKPLQTKNRNKYTSADEDTIIREENVDYLDGTKKPFTYSVKTKSGKRIRYDEEGFPDLSDHLYEGPAVKYNTVKIELAGIRRELDFKKADNLVGLTQKKREKLKLVWHHHQELGVMQLVSQEAHNAAIHTGSVSIYNQLINKGVLQGAKYSK